MPYNKSKNTKSKNFQKKVTEIVRKQISQEVEEKHALIDYANVFLRRAIPSGVVLNGQGNFFKILPPVEQSTTGAAGRAYNTRIGNEINLKSIDILGMINYAALNATSVDPQNAKLAVRIMILRAKEVSDTELLFDNMPTDTLIRFSNSTGTSSGAGPYNGSSVDPFRSINRDTFSVKYDKIIYLDAPVLLPGSSSPDVSVVPSRSKMFKHKLTFGKNGLKLKYSTSTDTEANNFPYFMVMGYASQSSFNLPGDFLATCNVSCAGTFTDA